MAKHDNTYSRFVAWLKVLLPVMALMLLSTMFLISRSIDTTKALTYAEVNVDELVHEQRVTGPRFSGVTSDGAAISFSAESAQSDNDNPAIYTATDLNAQIETPDGGVIDIHSTFAQVDNESNQLEMSGGVSLITSTHYSILTEGLRASMDRTGVSSIGPVTAEGPAGLISAGQIDLVRQGGEIGTYLLVFKNGVKLVYVPENDEDE